MILNLIETEPEGSNTSDLLKTLLKYLIRHGTVSKPKDFSQELTQKILTRRESMGNIAEYFMEEGLQKGRQEGRHEGLEKGRHEGEMIMLKNLLKLKFGTLPPSYFSIIEKADSKSLLLWGQRILNAESIEEIFEDTVSSKI